MPWQERNNGGDIVLEQRTCCMCGAIADVFGSQTSEMRTIHTRLCTRCYDKIQECMNELVPLLIQNKKISPIDFLESKYSNIPQFIKDTVHPNDNEIKEASYIEPRYVFTPEQLNQRCDGCGIVLEDFLLQNQIWGCPMCWVVFKNYIKEFIGFIELKCNESSDRRVEITKLIASLEHERANAIELEDWDIAIKCRDEIKQLQTELDELS